MLMPESDDYAAELRGDMNINSLDIPKSTVVLAGILYGVLASLMTWNLITTINIKDKQADDIKTLAVEQARTNGRVESLEGRVTTLERAK